MLSKEQQDRQIEETRLLVNLFLKTNGSDIELSKQTGITSSTVGRRLTNIKLFLLAFPDGKEKFKIVADKRQSNLQKAKVRGGQTSFLNNLPIKDENGKFLGSVPKIRLDLICDDAVSELVFLKHLALTFRAQLPLLASLFQMDEKEVLTKVLMVANDSYEAVLYLFYHDRYDQELAKQNLLRFYRDLLNAKNKKDEKTKGFLKSQINNQYVINIQEKILNHQELQRNDYYVIFNYQLKYALSNDSVCIKFGISRENYSSMIETFLAKDDSLKERYYALLDYLDNKNLQRKDS